MNGEKYGNSPWLIIHIMKTGGTSFRRYVEGSEPNSIYPSKNHLRANPNRGNYVASEDFICLIKNGKVDVNKYKYLFGHYPFSIIKCLDIKFKTAAFFRDPINRSISMIRHRRKLNPEQYGGLTDIEMLDLKHFRDRQITNYQTKVFAMENKSTLDVNYPLKIDEYDLNMAINNIRKLDYLGLTERMQDSIKIWNQINKITDHVVSVPWLNESLSESVVDDGFIEKLNPYIELDLKLYEEAKKNFREFFYLYIER